MLEKFSNYISKFCGSNTAFVTSLVIIILWAAAGPLFNYGDSWQLFINTGTTIITFLMVFLIQRTQNKDVLVLHTKLNELIRALSPANNKLIAIEEKSEEEVAKLHKEIAMVKQREEQAAPVASALETTEGSESAQRSKVELQVSDPKDAEAFKKLLEGGGDKNEKSA